MSDFIADLERELLGAARRRAEQRVRAPRRTAALLAIAGRRLGRPPIGRAVVALATLALIVGAVFALRPAPRRPDDRPVASGTVLAEARTPQPCGKPAYAHMEPAPADVIAALAVLRRPRTPQDGLPRLPAAAPTWLPTGDWGRANARRVAVLGGPDVWILPTADLRSGAPACGDTQPRGAGACLLTAIPVRFACFTLAQIRAGAFALFGTTRHNRRLIGLVADGPSQVHVRIGGAPLAMTAVANVVVAGARAARAGARVTVVGRTPTVAVLNGGAPQGTAAAAADKLTRDLKLRPQIGYADRADGTVTWYAGEPFAALAATVRNELGGTVAQGRPPDDKSGADVMVVIGRTR